MNKLENSSALSSFQLAEQMENLARPGGTLRSEVENALYRYFQHIDGEPVTNLYEMVLREVEAPLLEAVMRHTRNNQSKASILLGLNRGTLRSKLKQYGML